jgi:hypothetical protein
MSAMGQFLDVIERLARTGRSVANIGKPQLIKQLDAVRANLQSFKEAAVRNEKSEMRVLLAECEAESKMLEKRLFKGLDAEMSKILKRDVGRARRAKMRMHRSGTRTKSLTKRKAIRSTKKTIQETFAAKGAELAKTMNSRKEENRQRLIAEIDTAIGRLRGISKSLENLSL